MVWLSVALIAAGMVVSLPVAAAGLALARRLGAVDRPGLPGQEKFERRSVPNVGGVAIFAGVTIPMLAALAAAWWMPAASISAIAPAVVDHLPGIRARTPLALTLLGALAALHAVGLIDDRRPMRPWPKLFVMLAAAATVVAASDTRLLTALDAWTGMPWLSFLLTILWIVAVTNAMNFMDNMDALAGSVTVIASGAIMAAALVAGQWFVASALALLIGATLGFLVFNLPPARLYMGDAGSLVIGFLLGVLTVRTTYVDPAGTPPQAGAWHAVFTPLVVLAVPMYDLVSVTFLRLARGRNPFVGDTWHLSHRLVRLGLSPRGAVAVVSAATAATAIAGIALGSLRPWQAALVAVQVGLVLLMLAILELAAARARRRDQPPAPRSDQP